MSASKDKERGTWKIYLRYVDWQGVKQIHTKRGFTTKREALEYEREFLASKSRDLNMLFESFVEIYLNDLRPRIKYNTYLTKVHIIETKIIPYFAKKSIAEITAPDILQWQNELLKKSDGEGKQYSQTYLRTIQNQLNAILNHANKYYGLTSNPAHKTTKMGKSKAQEMLFWTKEEYEKFVESVKSKPASYYAFEILYELIEKYGCTFIMMYHTKKDSSIKSVSEKVISSQALSGSVDTIIAINKSSEFDTEFSLDVTSRLFESRVYQVKIHPSKKILELDKIAPIEMVEPSIQRLVQLMPKLKEIDGTIVDICSKIKLEIESPQQFGQTLNRNKDILRKNGISITMKRSKTTITIKLNITQRM